MPTYDYQCKECQHHFTDFVSMDERKAACEAPCPNCKKENVVEQVMSAPSIILDNTKLTFRKKMDGRLKERLQEIKKNNPGSKIDV